MAIGARRQVNVPLTVTLNTDPSGIPGRQEETVRGAMRNMAARAPLHFHSLVLKYPGSPFLGMAFKADIVIEFVPFLQTGPCPGPMRSVAVGAFQCTFQNFMPVGKIKFALYFLVAGKTEIGLFPPQEVLCEAMSHDLMAAIAHHTT